MGKTGNHPLISIILPTHLEGGNIESLVAKIDDSLQHQEMTYEIIIVDDNSCDGIEDHVIGLKDQFNISLHVRKEEKGLATAVIEGFRHIQGDIVLVMDADHSHPPEKIPEMVRMIQNGQCVIAVGSRFVEGGAARHFSLYRKLNAHVAKLFSRPFTSIKDPMAGFFAFNRNLITPDLSLNPVGFKILLELIVKAEVRSIIEVPIRFQKRLSGHSKLNFYQQLLFFRHVLRLLIYKYMS